MNDACLQHPSHHSGLSAPRAPRSAGDAGGAVAVEATGTGMGRLWALVQQPIILSHVLTLVGPLSLYKFFLQKAQPSP